MIEVRRAGVADAPELVRLRGVMLAGMGGAELEPGPWQQVALDTLRERLADPGGPLAAFVVDKPDRPPTADRPAGLAACVVGVIDCRLPGPSNPAADVGYVLNVATDPGYRRRGYSRACMESLLGWYRRRHVARVDLRASPEAEPLYRSLGFVALPAPTMRLSLPLDGPTGPGGPDGPIRPLW